MANEPGIATRMMVVLVFLLAAIGSTTAPAVEQLMLPPGIANIWGARMADINSKESEIVVNIGPNALELKEPPRRQQVQDQEIMYPPSSPPILSTLEPFPTPKELNGLIVSDAPYEYEDINDQGFSIVDYPLPKSLIQKQLMRLGVDKEEDLEKIGLPFPINLAPAKMFRAPKEKYPPEAEKKRNKPKVKGRVTIIPMTHEEMKTSLWPFANFGENGAKVEAIDNSVGDSENREDGRPNFAPLVNGTSRATTTLTSATDAGSDVTQFTAEISEVIPPDLPETKGSHSAPGNTENDERQSTTTDEDDNLEGTATNFPFTPTTPFWIETSTALNKETEDGATSAAEENDSSRTSASQSVFEGENGTLNNDTAVVPPLLVYDSRSITSRKANNEGSATKRHRTITTINVKASTISLMDNEDDNSSVDKSTATPFQKKESQTLPAQSNVASPIQNQATQGTNAIQNVDPFSRFLLPTDEPLPNRPRVPDNSAYLSTKSDGLIGYKAGGEPVFRDSSNSGFATAHQSSGPQVQLNPVANPYQQPSSYNPINQRPPQQFTTIQQQLAPVQPPPTNPATFQTGIQAIPNAGYNYGGYARPTYSNQAPVSSNSGGYGGYQPPPTPVLSPTDLARTAQQNAVANPRLNRGKSEIVGIRPEHISKDTQQPVTVKNLTTAADPGKEKQISQGDPRFHNRIGTENVNQAGAETFERQNVTVDPRLFAPNIMEQQETWPSTPPSQAAEFSGTQFPETSPPQAIEFMTGLASFPQPAQQSPQPSVISLVPPESYELGPDGIPLNVEYCCKEGEPVFPRPTGTDTLNINKDSPFGTWSNGTHYLIQVKPLPFGGVTRAPAETIPASSIATTKEESSEKRIKIKKIKQSGITGRESAAQAFANKNVRPLLPPPFATPAPFVRIPRPTSYGPPGVSPETFAFGLSSFNISDVSDSQINQDLPINQIAKSNECFFEKRGCILVNAAPSERRIGISEKDCLAICQKYDICRAVVFADELLICDIFPAEASVSPSKLVKLQGYTYFEPNDAPGCPKKRNSKENFPNSNSLLGVVEFDQSGLTSPIPTATPTPAVTPTPTAVPDDEPKEFCAKGTAVIFQRAEGWELVGNDGADISPINEAECVSACTSNKTPAGAKFQCSSIDYQPDSQTCILSNEAAAPQRFGVLTSQENSIYYEKTCLGKEFVQRCAGRDIERHSQRVMRGFGETVESVANMWNCIELCFQSEDLGLGFKCRSIMYFLEEKSFNCMLNSASHVTEPSFFVVEETNRVEYAGIDNCLSPGEGDDDKIKSEPTTPLEEGEVITTDMPESERLVSRNDRNMEAVKRNFNAKTKPRDKLLKQKKIRPASAPLSGKFKSLNFASPTLLQNMEKQGFLPDDDKILKLLHGPATEELATSTSSATAEIFTETAIIDDEEEPKQAVTGGLRVKSFTIRRSLAQPVLKDTQIDATNNQYKSDFLTDGNNHGSGTHPAMIKSVRESANYGLPTTRQNIAFVDDAIEHDSVTRQEMVETVQEFETIEGSGYSVTVAPVTTLRTNSKFLPNNFKYKPDGTVVRLGEWMAWSECGELNTGQRKRYVACEAEKFEMCPFETEPCAEFGKLTVQKDDAQLLSLHMLRDQPVGAVATTSSTKSTILESDLSKGSPSETDEFAGPCLPFNGDCRIGVRLMKNGAKRYCLEVDAELCR